MPPLTLRIRIQLAVFAVVALIFAAAMAIGYIRVPAMFGIGRYQVTVQLPRTAGVYPGGNVTFRGAEVGRIKDVRLTDTGVAAVLSLKSGIAHLPGETGSQRVQGLKVVRYGLTVTAKGVLHEDYVSLLGKATARRLCALSIVQGTGTGKVATFSLPYTELEAVPVQDSRDDIALVNLSWRVRDNAGSDAFTLTLT